MLWIVLAIMSATAGFIVLRPFFANPTDKPSLKSLPVLAGAVLLPGLALLLYLVLGMPGYPDLPLADRLDAPPETLPLEGLVVQLERKLKKNPADREGWLMLARTRMALGEADRAEDALVKLIALNQGRAGADALVMLAEARLQQRDGLTDDSIDALVNQALEINPGHARGRYLHGLSLLQQGDEKSALSLWQSLLAEAGPDTQWHGFLSRQIARHP